MVIIITPNWLSVDNAIIFLKSFSHIADIPAMIIVKTLIIINNLNIVEKIITDLNRIKR